MKRNTAILNQIIGLILLSLFLFLSSCGNKNKQIKIDPAFAAYVISFTSGVVPNSTTIQVRLVEEIPDAVPGKVLPFNPFSFDDDIKGQARWLDKQTIEFIPEKRLPSGEEYIVDFALHKFVKVPDELSVLTFKFQVIRQSIKYEFNGMSPYKEEERKWQKVKGILYTADFAEFKPLEYAVKAFSEKNNYKISWKHNENGRVHEFSIDSVERKDERYVLKIEWDGEEIGAQKGLVNFEVPALNEFSVLHLKTSSVPKASIEIFFSDPLSKSQDMNGLFRLNPDASEWVIVEGNIARIIPGKPIFGDVTVFVSAGVKNIFGDKLGKEYSQTVKFVNLKPQVELIGDGVIVPNSGGVLFPFRAVSLSAVDVKIIQIYENNIVQFLQTNQFDGKEYIKRVGRVEFMDEVQLTSDDPIDYNVWNNFSLDLSKLIEISPGAIYRVEISFRKKHSLYPCAEEDDSGLSDSYVEENNPNEGYNEPNNSYWDYYEDQDYDYYSGEEYNWEERDNPCKASYYMYGNHKVARNILASDFGIIVKGGSNNEYFVAVTDLRTTEPIGGVELEFRNLQNQPMQTVKTNSDGLCSVKLTDKAFVLIAQKNKQKGYLRLDNASSLSLSMFDVNGVELKKGIKGYVYGERGVWRPGDIIYLNFILEDKNKILPPNHPVVLELYNPLGQLSQRIVRSTNVNGFYFFNIKTADDAQTGNWLAKIKVGGSTFTRNLRVETVKPNRMKIDLQFPDILHQGVIETGKLQVNWLYGAPASNAKVMIEATAASIETKFKGYNGYVFDDQAKSFASEDITVYNGNVNANGSADVNFKFNLASDAPGMIALQIKTRAFEAGGDFSVDRAVFKYSPFKAYVGLKMPEGKGWNNALYSNEKNLIPMVLIDENGKPLNGKLKIEIFNVYWRWWWDRTAEENLANYVSSQHSNLIKTDYVNVVNGRAMYAMNLGGEYWGRKYMRVSDMNGRHSSGAVFYTTYKGWWSNAGSENPGGAEMLMFQPEKKKYKVGEEVSVELPVTHQGKALISIETGSKVIENFWFTPEKGKSKFHFEVTPEMAPNIYIHVSYIQPHNHGENDLPIRMYGVQSVSVEDPETHIKPVILMKDELKPEEKFTVTIKEANGNPMTCTVAIVDEGILDLTRFKTPDPWSEFYAHEALGVRTWDLYKYVAGAFTGKLSGLYSIGGDEYLNKKGKENSNRFKPVVLFQEPISLKKKESKTLTFEMPNYIGSVRVMVVAGNKGAYGSAEKAVPVKQSLMVLPTLPRVISPSEVIKVPVTVFVTDKSLRNVNVELTSDDHFDVIDGKNRQLKFDKPGEKVVEFSVKAKNLIAQGKIMIKATSGSEKATSETDLKIRMPNPPISKVRMESIEPGKTWSEVSEAIGIKGTNSGVIEVSKMYPLNIEKRLNYLIQYPHGCIEQITSAAFPQLFLKNLMDLSDVRKGEIESNVNACLNKIQSYQLSNGAFAYWPNYSYGESEWGTNYAGHFMLEAQAQGYELPLGLLEPWITYQTSAAENWQPKKFNNESTLIQAYRLYTLALAKRPALGAMNRLRESPDLNKATKWRLAAAYAVTGKADIASKIVDEIEITPEKVNDYYWTYGSYDRDKAMILETLILLKQKGRGKPLIEDIASKLSSEEWLSTQSVAYMLLAVSKYVENNVNDEELICDISVNGSKTKVKTEKPFYQLRLDYNQDALKKQISITNRSKQTIFVRIQQHGCPLMTEHEASAENLSMTVMYYDMKGNLVNPELIHQGTDFYAEITVLHPNVRSSYNDLAIQQLFPSGWEIINTRMDEIQSTKMLIDEPTYQDIRDDRVYKYFDLPKGNKKVFRVLLHASYLGSFYMPAVQCESMYDNTIYARTSGKWVKVVK